MRRLSAPCPPQASSAAVSRNRPGCSPRVTAYTPRCTIRSCSRSTRTWICLGLRPAARSWLRLASPRWAAASCANLMSALPPSRVTSRHAPTAGRAIDEFATLFGVNSQTTLRHRRVWRVDTPGSSGRCDRGGHCASFARPAAEVQECVGFGTKATQRDTMTGAGQWFRGRWACWPADPAERLAQLVKFQAAALANRQCGATAEQRLEVGAHQFAAPAGQGAHLWLRT